MKSVVAILVLTLCGCFESRGPGAPNAHADAGAEELEAVCLEWTQPDEWGEIRCAHLVYAVVR